jgi:hypothetical protein
MDPNLWGALPRDLLERIARFADIDTRRAMGFKPGKLPRIDLKFPLIEQESPRLSVVRIGPMTNLFLQDCRYMWMFVYGKGVLMDYETRKIHIDDQPPYTHPDFHEDGSFKR